MQCKLCEQCKQNKQWKQCEQFKQCQQFIWRATLWLCFYQLLTALNAMICFSPCVRYMSELFYIGPIYHLAFTKLDKMIMLDSTDLGVLSDLEVHISLSSQEQCWHCNSGPVVRVLWTWEFWRLPLGRWSWPRPALLQSGDLFSLRRRFPLLHLPSWTIIEGNGQAARLASLAGWAFTESWMTLIF